jgi:hypothetical protein
MLQHVCMTERQPVQCDWMPSRYDHFIKQIGYRQIKLGPVLDGRQQGLQPEELVRGGCLI